MTLLEYVKSSPCISLNGCRLKSALYFVSAIKKVIQERFDYNAKATKIGLKNTIIELPILNNKVDYKFMEDFIKVVQKLVIKDVVLWMNEKNWLN